jgi:ubiquinone/menaquinone biosynthesis C-methylase UbiE
MMFSTNGATAATPLSFLGPLEGRRILLCGAGVEAVTFALAGSDVYGFDGSGPRIERIKDRVRSLGLRERIHLHTGYMGQLAYPNEFFHLAFGRFLVEDGDLGAGTTELTRVLMWGGRAAFILPARGFAEKEMRHAFGVVTVGDCWIGGEKAGVLGNRRATGRIRTDDRSITNRELYP